MSTPVINAIDNVNQTSLNSLFTTIVTNSTAVNNLSQSNRNIDKVSTNVPIIEIFNNTNEDAIRKLLSRRAGEDPSNFNSLSAVVTDQNVIQSIASTQSSNMIAFSNKAITPAASSQTAMIELADSGIALENLASSDTAMTEIDKNNFTVKAIMCGNTNQDPTTFADANAIAQDTTAMTDIADSAPTMKAIAASQAAMAEVANSQTAINKIGSVDNESEVTPVLNSSIATTELTNSSLTQTFSNSYTNASTASGTITDKRVLVLSNNVTGTGGTTVDYNTAVGQPNQTDTTFIANGASTVPDPPGTENGSISFTAIPIQ